MTQFHSLKSCNRVRARARMSIADRVFLVVHVKALEVRVIRKQQTMILETNVFFSLLLSLLSIHLLCTRPPPMHRPDDFDSVLLTTMFRPCIYPSMMMLVVSSLSLSNSAAVIVVSIHFSLSPSLALFSPCVCV